MCFRKENNIIEVKNRKVFLSYCADDKPVVELIKNKLIEETDGMIEISEYTEVQYKEDFVKFMSSIKKHQFALCVVSDGYLKSPNCMYEVGEFIFRDDFEDKMLFVVLSDKEEQYYKNYNAKKHTNIKNTDKKCVSSKYKLKTANVYKGFDSKVEYTLYWQDVYEKQKEELKKLHSYKARRKLKKDLQKTKRIYEKDIPIFINFLSNYNGKSFSELYENNLKDILNFISSNKYRERFKNCKDFAELFNEAINEISIITGTDYNQIALSLKIDHHKLGLVVVADKITARKQRYRLVDLSGYIAAAFSNGKIYNISNVKSDKNYFPAVRETKSEIVIPICIPGKVIGVINSECDFSDHFKENIEFDLKELSNAFAAKIVELGYSSNMSYNEIPYISI